MENRKKRLFAREFLILIASISILLLCFLFLIVNNNWRQAIAHKHHLLIEKYQTLLDSLPKGGMVKVYRMAANNSYQWYKINDDTMLVAKDWEMRFLRDYPKAILIKAPYDKYKDRLQNDRFKTYFSKDMIKNAPMLVDNQVIYPDGTIEPYKDRHEEYVYFSFLEYNDFMRKLDETNYSYDFYNQYKDSLWSDIYSFKDFKSFIQKNKGYNNDIRKQRINLHNEIAKEKEKRDSNISCIIDGSFFILISSIIVLSIAFPIRYLILAILWAIKIAH